MEQRLREEIKSKIDEERRKLEAEFARNAELLELARREKDAAEAARKAAAEDAEQIISEYKDAHDRLRSEEEKALREERERLETNAVQIQRDLEEARSAKAESERNRRASEELIEDFKREQAEQEHQDSEDAAELERLGSEIAALQSEAEQAAVAAEVAERATAEAEQAQAAHEGNMERQEHLEEELENRIATEVSGWIEEQEGGDDAPGMQQQILANQREHMERIKRRAEQARREASQGKHSNILDEVASKLDE
jgi:hypothetical protein